jgi:3',5'-nucleoside bisphosphate phosphatase
MSENIKGMFIMKTCRAVTYFLLVFCVAALPIACHRPSSSSFGEDYFPDVPGYQTLIGDFHLHTVFSDEKVWPTVRVDEAKREGLDVIALTDHIEDRVQKHKDDLSTNRNRAYEITARAAKKANILLIKGAGITPTIPPGHHNALFLDDIEQIVVPEPKVKTLNEQSLYLLDVVEKANEQKAFVFWNHHGYRGEKKGRWTDTQTTMYEKKWLHGIEVASSSRYYPKAHQWCIEKNLTMLGNSDLHLPSFYYPYTANQHRPLTLVFAKERTVESVKEALWAGRTAVWFENQIIGRKQYLEPLFNSCVTLSKLKGNDEMVQFELANNALIDLELEIFDKFREVHDIVGPSKITIPARSAVIVRANLPKDADAAKLFYEVEVTNFLIEPMRAIQKEHPQLHRGLIVKFDLSGALGALVETGPTYGNYVLGLWKSFATANASQTEVSNTYGLAFDPTSLSGGIYGRVYLANHTKDIRQGVYPIDIVNETTGTRLLASLDYTTDVAVASDGTVYGSSDGTPYMYKAENPTSGSPIETVLIDGNYGGAGDDDIGNISLVPTGFGGAYEADSDIVLFDCGLDDSAISAVSVWDQSTGTVTTLWQDISVSTIRGETSSFDGYAYFADYDLPAGGTNNNPYINRIKGDGVLERIFLNIDADAIGCLDSVVAINPADGSFWIIVNNRTRGIYRVDVVNAVSQGGTDYLADITLEIVDLDYDFPNYAMAISPDGKMLAIGLDAGMDKMYIYNIVPELGFDGRRDPKVRRTLDKGGSWEVIKSK